MTARQQADVAIIGAGMAGLAHALEAAKRGLKVVVFERYPQAVGSSVRNFGMIFPFGVPHELREIALRGRAIWLEVAQQAGFWVKEAGAILLAHSPHAWAVFNEFQEGALQAGYDTDVLDAPTLLARYPYLNSHDLHGGLWTRQELTVDPREAIATLPAFLAEHYGVVFHYSTPVTHIDLPNVTANGKTWQVGHVVVCSGTEFELLYPDDFKRSGLFRTKLQMMRTVAQPHDFTLEQMMVGTLSAVHYPTFTHCAGLPALRAELAERYQPLIERGIHVMAVQNGRGEIVLGDSHDNAWFPDPFNDPETNRMILAYLQSMLSLPTYQMAQEWEGIYSKHPERVIYLHTPAERVRMLSVGGLGMTLSFGQATETLNDLGL